MKYALITATAALGLAAPALAQDADAGERAFAQCRSCHMVADDQGNTFVRGGRTGPNLWGLPGRAAGTDADFPRYIDAIQAAGEAGLTWNEEDFVSYTQDPQGFLREYLDDPRARSGMSFRLRSEEDARDIWAYLVSVSPEVEDPMMGDENMMEDDGEMMSEG